MIKEGISLAVIMLNEEKYIDSFLTNVVFYKQRQVVNEVVLVDGLSTDGTVFKCVEKDLPVIIHPFTFHFGDQRNFAITQTHYSWVLMLDIDEFLEEGLIQLLPVLIKDPIYQAYKIPRKNFIDGVEDTSSYPDLQVRLFKRHCRWIHPVHEELVGWKKAKVLEGLHIIHNKTSERHTQRNRILYPFLSKLWETDKS